MKPFVGALFHYLREAELTTRAQCASYMKHPKTGAKSFCTAPPGHGNKHQFGQQSFGPPAGSVTESLPFHYLSEGGAGSGNFGHADVAGVQGGSAPGGGGGGKSSKAKKPKLDPDRPGHGLNAPEGSAERAAAHDSVNIDKAGKKVGGWFKKVFDLE